MSEKARVNRADLCFCCCFFLKLALKNWNLLFLKTFFLLTQEEAHSIILQGALVLPGKTQAALMYYSE